MYAPINEEDLEYNASWIMDATILLSMVLVYVTIQAATVILLIS
jgi:hypothetical protein